jgi:hypothetical protein
VQNVLVFFVGTQEHLRGAPRRPPTPPPASLGDEKDPLETPSDATPPPSSLSSYPLAALPSSPLVSLSLHHVQLTVTGTRRLALPFRAPPCSSEVLRRSPLPSSTSPFKELTRGASNRRHHRGYLAGNELLRRQNSSTPAILRPR